MYQHAKAGYPYLWINSSEDDRIIREQRKKIPPEVSFMRWDIVEGLRGFVNPNGDATQWVWKPFNGDLQNPVEALQAIQGAPEDTIIFMHDFHEFFQDVMVQRCALNLKDHLKATSKMIVFLSHGTAIPAAMRDAVKILNFDMPDGAELHALLTKICKDTGMPMPENHDRIVDAMRGLTLEGAENALALSLVSKGTFDYKIVLEAKAAALKATGYLEYTEHGETFKDLYGLEYLKDYALKCIASGKGKGILLYGYPGTGKSHFSKALANELQLPCLSLSMSGLLGGIVGESEQNTRDAVARIQAFNKSIVFVDEIEKSIEGMEDGSKSDGGVKARQGQELLKYLEDRPYGKDYWTGTCNGLDTIINFSGGAFLDRFDAVFFLDMPSQKECQGIARIWSEKENVDIPENFDFEGWTGRNIKKLAKTMSMMECDAEKASTFVIPTAQALGPRVDDIRKKAMNVCIPASASEPVKMGVPAVRKIKVAK